MELNKDRTLKEDVFQILDSRIQYIEYQLNSLSRQSNTSANALQTLEEPIIIWMERIFKQIEQYNKSLKTLLFLRSQLNALNTPIILDLLTNGRYLKFDDLTIREMLGLDHNTKSPGEQLLSNSAI